jgi:glutamate racemase
MEPAVKPAAEHTHTRVVGVLATPATFQGELYASVVERFAQGVVVLQDTCPGLVAKIESGDLDGPGTRHILENALRPMLVQGIDTVVMGCTHYPFVIPLVREIAGPAVRVIDPAPAVARQVRRLLEAQSLVSSSPPVSQTSVRYLTTADPQALQRLLPQLVGETGTVQKLTWIDDQLINE